MSNKEVKTETLCKRPPLNTIKEYFTPILLGLRREALQTKMGTGQSKFPRKNNFSMRVTIDYFVKIDCL